MPAEGVHLAMRLNAVEKRARASASTARGNSQSPRGSISSYPPRGAGKEIAIGNLAPCVSLTIKLHESLLPVT